MEKILLIEDDDKFRKMLSLLLQSEGYEVAEASNGRKGISTAAKEEFDLIITDIFMPDQDGLEVVQAMVKSQSRAKTLVISGGGKGGGFQYLDYAKTFGADKTMTKPFENHEFLEAVTSLLDH